MTIIKAKLDHIKILVNVKKRKQTKQRTDLLKYKSIGNSIFLSIRQKFSGDFAGFRIFRKNLVRKLLREFRKNPNFIGQAKLKSIALGKLTKQRGYKYFRMQASLPWRGQRTHTNARTRKRRDVV